MNERYPKEKSEKVMIRPICAIALQLVEECPRKLDSIICSPSIVCHTTNCKIESSHKPVPCKLNMVDEPLKLSSVKLCSSRFLRYEKELEIQAYGVRIGGHR